MRMNPNAKRVKAFLRAQGFKTSHLIVESGAIRVLDEGGHCFSLVEWEISHTSDNLRLKVCSLYDMASDYAEVKKLHGRVI